MSKSKNRTQPNDLGALLRQWRGARNKSQMEASLDAGVSQRHLSFIEIGRSVPSRATLIGIAEALEIPFRDRNSLLLAAGYAPMYEDASWDEQELRGITEALNRMLRQHEPYPAIVMDRYWNVLQTNTAAPRFFNSCVNLSARPQPRNLLHLMFDPAGMQATVRPRTAHGGARARLKRHLLLLQSSAATELATNERLRCSDGEESFPTIEASYRGGSSPTCRDRCPLRNEPRFQAIERQLKFPS